MGYVKLEKDYLWVATLHTLRMNPELWEPNWKDTVAYADDPFAAFAIAYSETLLSSQRSTVSAVVTIEPECGTDNRCRNTVYSGLSLDAFSKNIIGFYEDSECGDDNIVCITGIVEDDLLSFSFTVVEQKRD